MAKPKEILNASDYANYRNIRAAGALFIFLGILFVLGGIGLFLDPEPGQQKTVHPAFPFGLMGAAVAGIIGGISCRRGNRRMAPLIYTVAVLYLLFFPIGTILGVVTLRGLARYFDSADAVRNAASSPA